MRTKTHPGLFVLEFVINPSVSACLLLTLLPISSVLLPVTASSSQVLQRGSEAYNLPATVDKGTLWSSFRSQVCVLKWQDRANWDTLDSRNISIAANLHIVQGGPGCVSQLLVKFQLRERWQMFAASLWKWMEPCLLSTVQKKLLVAPPR